MSFVYKQFAAAPPPNAEHLPNIADPIYPHIPYGMTARFCFELLRKNPSEDRPSKYQQKIIPKYKTNVPSTQYGELKSRERNQTRSVPLVTRLHLEEAG